LRAELWQNIGKNWIWVLHTPEKYRKKNRRDKMNIKIKAEHFTMHDDAKEYLNKKLERLHNAENMIVDLLIVIKKEKDFDAEATVNFRWGVSIHVKEADFDLTKAIDTMIDKLEAKITKEKEKVKEKR
jgi:putative sigma-54 modulation protein